MERAVRGARNPDQLTGVPVSPFGAGHLSFVISGLVKVPVVLMVLRRTQCAAGRLFRAHVELCPSSVESSYAHDSHSHLLLMLLR